MRMKKGEKQMGKVKVGIIIVILIAMVGGVLFLSVQLPRHRRGDGRHGSTGCAFEKSGHRLSADTEGAFEILQ